MEQQVTNPASQQPAPIPDDLKDDYAKLHGQWQLMTGNGYVAGLIDRIARLEAALRALRTYMWAEGYADQTAVMRQADAALGTPGKGEK
jgi:hypothetical protein